MSVDPETMEELLASETHGGSLRPLRVGERVEGTVAAISGEEATIDLGDRPAGVLSVRDAGAEQLRVGEHIAATVVQPEGPDGRVVLSLRRPRHRRRWTHLEELRRSGELIDAAVIDANRGGVVVDVGMRGFVPLSQLGSIGAIDTTEPGVPGPVRALVGKRLRLRVLEVDPKRDRLILSEKAATQQLRRERKARGAAELVEGDVREGTVVSVTSYGVFVDVGVADGLVHRSEITWERGIEPTSLFTVGKKVRVMVIGIDRERQRISLSIKRLGGDPWDRFVKAVQVGQSVEATVTRVMPYGAFARVAEGVEGLVHVSELADHRVADPHEVVRVGDVLVVKIVGVDAVRRHLSLSARLAGRT
ncbi:MAG TPA: S1 RNA-binding domain-containing protein [Candidatus Limnocylindria bacterium]|nr:S1 RNA-binding domain-containing protein [Candidatus Limnocylindria bacterium]